MTEAAVTIEPELDRKQLAEALNVSTDTIHRLTHSGDIPYIRPGRVYRYRLSEVRAALSPSQTDTWAPPSRKKTRRTA